MSRSLVSATLERRVHSRSCSYVCALPSPRICLQARAACASAYITARNCTDTSTYIFSIVSRNFSFDTANERIHTLYHTRIDVHCKQDRWMISSLYARHIHHICARATRLGETLHK
jgi:hypothetical protein